MRVPEMKSAMGNVIGAAHGDTVIDALCRQSPASMSLTEMR